MNSYHHHHHNHHYHHLHYRLSNGSRFSKSLLLLTLLLSLSILANLRIIDTTTVNIVVEAFTIHNNNIHTTITNNRRWTSHQQKTLLYNYPPRKKTGNKGDNNNNENENNNDNDDEEDDEYFDPLFDQDPFVNNPTGRRGDKRNWIEKNSPTGIGPLDNNSDSKSSSGSDGTFNLGIDGESFQTGPLSQRMYDALINVALKRFQVPSVTNLPEELRVLYKVYSMDVTAKEAVKAALKQNGFTMTSLVVDEKTGTQKELDMGEWGSIDNLRLRTNDSVEYKSVEETVQFGNWQPGESFSFTVYNVPAKLKEMDVTDVLNALDPDGTYREEAKQMGLTMPDEDVADLRLLGLDSERRANISPREVETNDDVWKGDEGKGYRIMKRSSLLYDGDDEDKRKKILMHVMDAFVNHGCLIIDLADSDNNTNNNEAVTKMNKMWQTTQSFFAKINEENPELQKTLPRMGKVDDIGSPNAVVGFISDVGDGKSNDGMQFLETRIVRNKEEKDDKESFLPKEVIDIVGLDGVQDLKDSVDVLTEIGKAAVRIAVTAASIEYGAFDDDDEDEDDENTVNTKEEEEEFSDLPFISGLTFEETELTIGSTTNNDDNANNDKEDGDTKAQKAAMLMTEELIDDGTSQPSNDNEGSVCMSPHRLCRYTSGSSSSNKEEKNAEEAKSSSSGGADETFGAHVDTSFVTIVPVADISGLEVYDEAVSRWYRPELYAQRMWEEEEQQSASSQEEEEDDGEEKIPWHSRYVVLVPGELLQICTRNEVSAAVHRVVTMRNDDDETLSRLSAPVLLRPRSGVTMNVERYFGTKESWGDLMSDCDGMKMEKIHDALQPSSFKQKAKE